jgi:hypothetical protein
MKKILLILLLSFSFQMSFSQMNITTTGNTVTFRHTLNSDWNSAPVYLYAYIEAASASNGVFAEVFGAWPGMQMVLESGSTYKIEKDLSTLYGSGITISNIKYIYNNNAGGQNPASGGFDATSAGFTGLTIATLGTEDISKAIKSNLIFASNKLTVNSEGNFNISIFNTLGALVKRVAIAGNTAVDLELSKGIYIANLESKTVSGSLKFMVK